MSKNKKNLKQRKRKHLKRAFKQVNKPIKAVSPAVEVKVPQLDFDRYIPPYKEPLESPGNVYKDRDKAYQERLDMVYNGTVTALTHYVNDNCSMSFKCHECYRIIFGKAGNIVGKEHQRHDCYSLTYGDIYCKRNISNRTTKGVKNTIKFDRFYEMVWNDMTPQQIASEMKVNPAIIVDYFLSEGLIEGSSNSDNGNDNDNDNDNGVNPIGDLTLFNTSKFGRKAFKDTTGKLFIECTSCNEVKHSDRFGNNKRGFHGKAGKCKGCASKRAKGK